MNRASKTIRCARPDCGNVFEAPVMHYAKFRSLFMAQGWRVRGSQNGPVYFCARHSD